MSNSREVLTFQIEDITDETDIPFATSPLEYDCMNQAAHRHSFYEIFYIASASGYHVVDSEPLKVDPPLFYFISPGQIHSWELAGTFEGFFLAFSEDFLVSPSSGFSTIEEVTFFHTVSRSPELRLDKEQAGETFELLRDINSEYEGRESNRASVLRAYLHILITRLQRLTHNSPRETKPFRQSSLVRKFKHLVTKNLLNRLSVREYAEAMGISESHLNNIMKSMTGYTPARLIHNETILEAKRLLIHSDLTVSEVGYHLNFEDPSYFSRFFKRETGLNPKQFRAGIREKYQLFKE